MDTNDKFSVTINADVSDNEYPFQFTNSKVDGTTIWTGLNESLPGTSISLVEREGELIDFSTLASSTDITTPHEVIYERFLQALNDLKESLIAGLEKTDDESIATKSNIYPYDPDSIKVRKESFSVFEINRMMTEEKDVDLNPDFQRNLVWDNARKSALIESILLGIPIPVFYFAESKSGTYHVVDGLQRLSTIKEFLANDFALKNLEHLTECEGKFYKESDTKPRTVGRSLERKYSRRLENAQFVINVIESASPKKVKYDIFKRINTGGRPLNHQEVRNCIAEDGVRKFLKEQAHSSEFELATGKSVSDYRMDAQELVLRFAGFKLEKEGLLNYTGDMTSYLNDVLDQLNDFTANRLQLLANDFRKAMRINYHLFGQYSFRKCLTEHLKPGARKQFINKALFTTWGIEVLSLDEKSLESFPVGFLAPVIAAEFDKRGKYYTIVTTGTSDKQNLKDAGLMAKQILSENL